MKTIEKYCDICGAKEIHCGYSIRHRIRHYKVRTKLFKWEKLDVCDYCYEEMRKLVDKKKQALKQMGE